MNAESRGLPSQDLTFLLDKAKDFHGHFGPFLVIGIRAGLMGLRELQTEKENGDLSAMASLTYSVPYSCILDGIQIATGCTLGNKRLRYEDSSKFTISFKNGGGKAVTVSILPKALDELTQRLGKDKSPEDVERLAYTVVSMPKAQLFIVERQ